jgi:hypothetical protein
MGSPKEALDWHGSTLLRRVTAWRLADVLGSGLTEGVRLNGEPLDPDLELPLVAGKVVAFA